MNCYLCNTSTFKIRSKGVRDNQNIDVIECEKCGLVTLSTINHIADNHYEDGKMHSKGYTLDTWILETEKDDNRRYQMLKQKIEGKSILDFGCGNAGFLIKSKLIAKYVEGVELEDSLQKYFQKKDLLVHKSINSTNQKFDLITSFHVFEHLQDPKKILIELAKYLNSDGEILIEVPNSEDALLTLFNNKEFSKFTYWSQHIFLFNQNTLTELVKQAGLKLNWVKQVQRYGLSNHLHWLATGKPGGHKNWYFFDDLELDIKYSNQLASIGKCDTIMASITL